MALIHRAAAQQRASDLPVYIGGAVCVCGSACGSMHRAPCGGIWASVWAAASLCVCANTQTHTQHSSRAKKTLSQELFFFFFVRNKKRFVTFNFCKKKKNEYSSIGENTYIINFNLGGMKARASSECCAGTEKAHAGRSDDRTMGAFWKLARVSPLLWCSRVFTCLFSAAPHVCIYTRVYTYTYTHSLLPHHRVEL